MAKKVSKAKGRSRGQIIERGKDKYLIRVFIGKDAAGKRKYSAKTVEGSFREAERELTKMVSEVDDKVFVEPVKDTVGAFMLTWLAGKKVQGSTLEQYEMRIAQDILPTLGHLKIQKITPADVQRAVDTWASKGQSPHTIQKSYMILSSAMRKAAIWGLIQRSPCIDIETPKVERTKAQVLTHEQTRVLLESTKGSPLHAMWAILLTCGLRPGEARALKFSDFDGGHLTVNHAVKAGTKTVGGPKTAAGRRRVSVPASTARIIEEHRVRMAKAVLRGQIPQNPEGWMFQTRRGTLLGAKPILMSWRRALKRAGLPKEFRLYDARHTHITHLLAAGVNPKVASERAGHASAQITLDVYSHVMPELQKQTADLVDNLLYGVGGA